MNKVHNLGSKKITTAIFVLLIGAIGGAILFTSNAATPTAPSIYLTPETTSININKQFTITAYENSGTSKALSAGIQFTYPQNLLDCNSVTAGGSQFVLETKAECANGVVTIARGTDLNKGLSGSLTGAQIIGTVTFTSKTTSGVAALTPLLNDSTGITTATDFANPATYINLISSSSKLQGSNITIDGVGPTVTIQGLANDQTINSNTATAAIINSTDSSELASLEIKIDGSSKQIINTNSKSYTYQWNNTGLLGSHTFQVIAKDALGNSGQSSIINVNIVDKTAPTVTLSPVTTPVAGTVTLSATASDSGGGNVSKVEFYAGSTKIGEDTTSPYSLLWNTKNGSFPDGSYSLTAKAYDNASPANMGTSNAVNVTVKNKDDVPPSAPSNLKLTNASQNSLTIGWSASTDNIGVTGYRVSRTGMQNVTVTNPSFTENNLIPNTSYTYTVVALDAEGNASVATTITATTVAQKVGDFDKNNKVDLVDLGIFINNYGTTNTVCDLNNDGNVTLLDLAIFIYNYNL